MDWTKEEKLQWSFQTTIQEFQETNPPLSLQEVLNPFVDNIETKKINLRIIENSNQCPTRYWSTVIG